MDVQLRVLEKKLRRSIKRVPISFVPNGLPELQPISVEDLLGFKPLAHAKDHIPMPKIVRVASGLRRMRNR